MLEHELGHGAVKHKMTLVGKMAENSVGMTGAPVDWNTGFDATNGLTIKIKDQGQSGSCGGQAYSYYMEVLEALATKTYDPLSARWPYSHVFVPGGGSSAPALNGFVTSNGMARESDATSYESGKPPSESFMETIPTLDNNAVSFEEITKAATPVTVTSYNIDSIASAIKQYNGVVIGITGANNGTWLSETPQIAPDSLKIGPYSSTNPKGTWEHWMYFYGYKMVNGKKMLLAMQSWGETVGNGGRQMFGEEWCNSDYLWHIQALSFDYQAPAYKQKLITIAGLLAKLLPLYKELAALKK